MIAMRTVDHRFTLMVPLLFTIHSKHSLVVSAVKRSDPLSL